MNMDMVTDMDINIAIDIDIYMDINTNADTGTNHECYWILSSFFVVDQMLKSYFCWQLEWFKKYGQLACNYKFVVEIG